MGQTVDKATKSKKKALSDPESLLSFSGPDMVKRSEEFNTMLRGSATQQYSKAKHVPAQLLSTSGGRVFSSSVLIDPDVAEKIKESHLMIMVFETATLVDVLNAIEEKAVLEGNDISSAIRSPFFRFVTKDNPQLSFKVSNTIARVIQQTNKINPEVSEMGRKKQKNNADDYAKNMFDVLARLKEEHGDMTFRETVKLLNEKQVPTYRGGQWHLKTLQELKKRFKDLDLA